MSTTATKLRLAEAIINAEAFRDLFRGCYSRWEFAGSIRRKRPEVGDIDHVVIGRPLELQGLFGGTTSTNAVREMVTNLLDRGTLRLAKRANGRKCNGDRVMAVQFHDCCHEIHLCEDYNWGCFLAMRTGSAEFSKALVTRMQSRGYRQRDRRLWRIERTVDAFGTAVDHSHPVDCLDEAVFFGAAGLRVGDWPPELRERIP